MSNPLQSRLAEIGTEGLVRIYNEIFSSPNGQLILEDLKMRGFFYTSTAEPEFCKVPGDTDRNEGTRKLLLYILDMTRPIEEHEFKQEDENG